MSDGITDSGGFGVADPDAVAVRARPARRATGRFVQPAVFDWGCTVANFQGIRDYLAYTHQEEFLQQLEAAIDAGLDGAECLVSMYAKLCYKSFTTKFNSNLTAVRDIEDNIKGILNTAHGSVFEHVSINLVVTDCSRVYTHEQVRHRVGAAYSQTSGRYCAIDPGSIQVVWDPILDGCEDLAAETLRVVEKNIYLMQCRLGLRERPGRDWPTTFGSSPLDCFGDDPAVGRIVHPAVMWVPKTKGVNFDFKKKVTSAMRRFAPNGQSNEMGMTLNLRTLRHTIMMRTARFAEYEIRKVYEQVYYMLKAKWPLMFGDAREGSHEGIIEVTGMKMNPYDQKSVEFYEDHELQAEMTRRGWINGLPPDAQPEVTQAVSAPVQPQDSVEPPISSWHSSRLMSGAEELVLAALLTNSTLVAQLRVAREDIAAISVGQELPMQADLRGVVSRIGEPDAQGYSEVTFELLLH